MIWLIKDGKDICRKDIVYTKEEVVKTLNSYEQFLKNKEKKISLLQRREEKYQRVIGGMMAFLELELNEELWWDWNE